MPYFPPKKFLDKYFYADDIAEILKKMGETPTGKKNNDIELLIKEWPRHGNDFYDFLEMLTTPELREICKKYNIDSKGDRQKLIKRIKKEKLFQDSNKKLKITGGSITIVGAFFFIMALYGAGPDTLVWLEFLGIHENNLEIIHKPPSESEILMLNQKPIDASQLSDGQVGFSYVNKTLGFMVSWPNSDWILTKDLKKHRESYGMDAGESYLGGVHLSREKGQMVQVAVFDITDPIKRDFEKWINLQIDGYRNQTENGFADSFISPEKNSARLIINGTINDQPFYMYERLLNHDDKIYLIQKHLFDYGNYPQQYLDEAESVRNSFQLLK